MAQATAITNTPRRDFLALAAAAATIAMARPAQASLPAAPSFDADPVFDMIEQYKKARHVLQEANLLIA